MIVSAALAIDFIEKIAKRLKIENKIEKVSVLWEVDDFERVRLVVKMASGREHGYLLGDSDFLNHLCDACKIGQAARRIEIVWEYEEAVVFNVEYIGDTVEHIKPAELEILALKFPLEIAKTKARLANEEYEKSRLSELTEVVAQAERVDYDSAEDSDTLWDYRKSLSATLSDIQNHSVYDEFDGMKANLLNRADAVMMKIMARQAEIYRENKRDAENES